MQRGAQQRGRRRDRRHAGGDCAHRPASRTARAGGAGRAPSARRPPAHVEEMRSYPSDLGHRAPPVGNDPVGMIVRRLSDLREHGSRQCPPRVPPHGGPAEMHRPSLERAVAGEGELASRQAIVALVDDAADRPREAGRPDPVQHHLHHRALAASIVAGLVERSGGEAVGRLLAGCWTAAETKRSGTHTPIYLNGHFRVRRAGLRHRQRIDRHGTVRRGRPGAEHADD